MIDIVLAEDHQLVRQGIRLLLESEPDLRVAGEAADGIEAIDLVQDLRPEVLLLDLSLPRLSGIEVVRRVRQQWPETMIVVLSMHNSEEYVLAAFQNGATGYVLKDSPASDLLHAVRQASLGQRYLSPPLSELAVESSAGQAPQRTPRPLQALTAREREIFHLAARGCSNVVISARLGISRRTVEAHKSNLMHKLGLHDHASLIHYAFAHRLLDPDTGAPDPGLTLLDRGQPP